MATILVTGASRGLGLEFTRQYLAAGDTVIAACRSPATAQALAQLGRDFKSTLSVLEIDVGDGESVRRAAGQVKTPVDVLLNCAGVMGGHGQRLGSIDYPEWRQVMEVNLMGPARMCEAFADHLARSARQLVVTITSGMGSLADNSSGGSILYRTSKAAVNMLMRSAAIDLRPRGIACVLLNPGWVKTDMGGPNARLSPEQSVSAMRGLIAGLGPDDSGRFYNYDGREYPW